jgi:hypothetical protein
MEDRSFSLRTDNASFAWLDRFRGENGNLSRWAKLLRSYCFDVELIPGRTNDLPIAFTQLPAGQTFQEYERCT